MKYFKEKLITTTSNIAISSNVRMENCLFYLTLEVTDDDLDKSSYRLVRQNPSLIDSRENGQRY